MLTTRPQRVRAIGSSSGWVTWKKPCSETSTTRRHWSSDMPAIGAFTGGGLATKIATPRAYFCVGVTLTPIPPLLKLLPP